jgi:hypothetical protein
MLGTQKLILSEFVTNDSDPSAGAGTSLTSGSSANTYGTWVQIHAGLTYPSSWIILYLNNSYASGAIANFYVDIGIGPSNSDVTVLIEKLCGSSAALTFGRCYYIPITIPPGIAIWARAQGSATSDVIYVNFSSMGGSKNYCSSYVCTSIECLGYGSSTNGTAITCGQNIEGDWTTIVSGTSKDYAGVMIGGMFTGDTGMTQHLKYIMDVGIGSSAPISIGENLTTQYVVETAEQVLSVSVPSIVPIPSGSYLNARVSCSGVPDDSQSIVLYGLVR